jgi:hypothetical protein
MHGKFSICHDTMAALLKVLHCDIHHPQCTTANSWETQSKPYSAHSTFKWRYQCVEYKPTTRKMWWLCLPLSANAHLPHLDGDLCNSDVLLGSRDTKISDDLDTTMFNVEQWGSRYHWMVNFYIHSAWQLHWLSSYVAKTLHIILLLSTYS